MHKTKTIPFDAAETLDTQTAIVEYLAAALETNDAAHISRSIGVAARAIGMAKIAKKAGLSRENLYRSLNGETKAELETVVRALSALDVRLTARAASQARPQKPQDGRRPPEAERTAQPPKPPSGHPNAIATPLPARL